ncbi:MAG: hypothetical protein HKN27_11935 [Silicimonas sp.]|nr:hypothetical protein [Silicimonas sp.]
MSETYLVVIPTDPMAGLPDNAQAVLKRLACMAGTDEARIKDYGKLQFIDCGEAFEGINCPKCAVTFEIATWHAWMDQDWHGEEGFHLHSHAMPCCRTKLTLNDLVYKGPQGFSRWFISAKTNNRGALTNSELEKLGAKAGIPLRAIIQQY